MLAPVFSFRRCFSIPLIACTVLSALLLNGACGEEAQWIWTGNHTQGSVPKGSCYFRKSFVVNQPQGGEIMVGGDDAYDVYVNGSRVVRGTGYSSLSRVDISEKLRRGRNVVAVKVENQSGDTAAFAARIQVQDEDGQWVSHSTGDGWKAETSPFPLWMLPVYNDRAWDPAVKFGSLGKTRPWDRVASQQYDTAEQPATTAPVESTTEDPIVRPETTEPVATTQAEKEIESYERFRVNKEFTVQRVLPDETAGSLIAMTFNEFGQLIVSREAGPLLLVVDTNEDQIPDTPTVCCDKVSSCQGLLSLNGDVYATGMGPDGSALYRLSDKDRDGFFETVVTLLKFTGGPSEHGPHGIALGPDGYLYITVGNHAGIETAFHESSPLKQYYEGDLVGPKYEDATGHAAGVKAPGGTIIRLPVNVSKVELVAGGVRNAYDLAFDAEGEMFLHDSDMESDMGMSWYRPTQVYHTLAGAELGWRSGWSKWPDYWYDALPAMTETGRGSPTGMAVYNHYMFPTKYHNAIFTADWSEGRILAIRTKRNGATFTATTETFLEGEPLNVTDLEVGADGALYFCTGGRGTTGGIYRIQWRGTVPEGMRDIGAGLTAAIRQPQIDSAWARQNVAKIRVALGEKWGPSLEGVARSETNPAMYRTRALHLMQLFGPRPSSTLLVDMSRDKNEKVRRKAAYLMGLAKSEATREALIDMLDDSDRSVRCRAAQSLTRAGHKANFTTLIDMLASDDRHESLAARKLLESMPENEWADRVLQTSEHRTFVQGGLALISANPSEENCAAVVARCQEHIAEFVSDRDFIDMLRLLQVALIQGDLSDEHKELLGEQLAEEFPAGDSQMNRELIRILAHLQVGYIGDRYVEYLASDAPPADKTHVAMHLRFINDGWKEGQRLKVLEYLESAVNQDGGASAPHYIRSVTLDMAKSLTPAEAWRVVLRADTMPTAALGAMYRLPTEINEAGYDTMVAIDEAIADKTGPDYDKLRIGVVAVLARSGNEQGFAYLRDQWERSPERRAAIAMGLAQKPDGENWGYLLSSLPVLDSRTAASILEQLRTVPKRPSKPETYRQVILKGLELKDGGADSAIALLEFWTGEQISAPGDDWRVALKAWQAWYERNYPDGPQANLPEISSKDQWDFDELLAYLAETQTTSDSVERGAAVYKKAQCASCHRHGRIGESMGPDLSAVSKRFSRKEILESIVYPSQVISDQYKSKKVLTEDGRQLVGLVAPGSAGKLIIMQPSGKKIEINEDEVEGMAPSKVSAMPEGLLNTLTLQEIADLFAFLQQRSTGDIATKPR